MGNVNKKARFFCSSCGAEVPQNARFCKTCGKFFTFVQCPKCAYSGDSKVFSFGCPNCGYAAKPGEFHSAFGSNTGSDLKEVDSSNKKNKKMRKGGDSSLPLWIYIITFATLIVVLFGVYSCL